MHLKKTFSRFGVILTLLLSIYSCNTTQDSSTDLITIDVEKAYNEPQRGIKLSEVVEDIEYVKLETNPECLIGRVFGVAISDNFIAVYGFTTKSILLFSRSGEFLHKIGSVGNGPGEYNYIEGKSLDIISNEQYIMFKDPSNTIYLYNIDGSFHKKTKTPAKRLDGFGYKGDGQILAYQQMLFLPEGGGNQLITYDLNLDIIDSTFFSTRDTIWVRFMQYAKDNFTINNGDIYLRSKLNDTIYKVHEDYSTERYLYFKMGSLKSPSLLVPGEEWEAKYLTLSDIALTDNHVYLTFAGRPRVPRPDVFGIEYLVYDKGSGNYYFLDDHPNLYAGEDNTTSAPINNLDGLDQTSEFIYHIRNDITWDVLEIVNAKEYLESDDFDPSKLSTDKYYKKVKKLLEESDIEDNPIIRICFLK